jgi:hypothetical protein
MSDPVSSVGRILPSMAGPALQTGVIADPPRNLAALAPGTIVKGTVLGRGSDGLVSVAIDQGTVKVATNAQLPPGSSVTLEVRNAGDRLQVIILAVESNNPRQAQAAPPPTAPLAAPPSGTAVPVSTNPSGATGPASGGTGSAAAGSAAGPASGGASPVSGAAGNTNTGAARPVEMPIIEVIGSSFKGVVVQAPPAASLLGTPNPDPEFFTLPASRPISVPIDAALKAQLLAQTLQAVAPDSLPTPIGASEGPGETVVPPPLQPVTVGGTPNNAPVSAAGIALQSDVAAKILALFAGDLPPPSTPANIAVMALSGAKPVATATLGLSGQLQIAAAGAPPALPAGTELTLHVIAVLPGQGQPIEIAPEAARLAMLAAPLVGRVLGYTKAGFPVVDTPAGAVMIQQKARLPVGAQVALAFEIAQSSRPDILPMPATPQQAMLYFSSGWPTLEDLFAVLAAAGPTQDDPDNPVTHALPQVGPKLAAGLLNAATALRSGDVEQLLGAFLVSRRLPVGKEDAVKRLRQEFSQISDLSKDQPDVDWRALYLPIYDERIGLSQINLYYRQSHGNGKDEPERKNAGTRFVVEVNFALLGAFQLDGLVRRKRFDLMIRSRKRLTQDQRREIHGIFEEALDLGGYAGSLEFRTVETFPVAPLDEMQQSHSRLMA